ncbi:MAG: 7-carboxy-7-deazaguanine synthase QueE [Gammaproteobacteria bacterium]
MSNLRITEIFHSLQGEASTVGWPTVFIRLTGCPLRCYYCDTAYAFSGGQMTSIAAILNQVANFNSQYVTVTGGEPLAQSNCLSLLVQLCDQGYKVSLETSGAMAIASVDSRVIKVVDVKTPASGMCERNRLTDFQYLLSHDQVKFVICDHNDYLWAKQLISQYQLHQRCTVLFSPSYQQVADRNLADWILEDQLPVRFQMQLHKYLWGDIPSR